MPAPAVAHLQVLDAEAAREVAGGSFERRVRVLVGRDDAAVDAERRRDQRVAEQQALHLGERQHADGLAVALGEQVMRAVAKRAVQHVLPLGQVEERALGVAVDEGVPRGAVRLAKPRTTPSPTAVGEGWGEGSGMPSPALRATSPAGAGEVRSSAKDLIHASPFEVPEQAFQASVH